MGLIEMASGNSVWCGMDYYERKMVCSWKKSGEEAYDGVVIVRLRKAGASSASI